MSCTPFPGPCPAPSVLALSRHRPGAEWHWGDRSRPGGWQPRDRDTDRWRDAQGGHGQLGGSPGMGLSVPQLLALSGMWGTGTHSRALVTPQHPVMASALCPWGAAQCQTPSFVPLSPAAPGAGGDPPLPVGVGTRDLCEQSGWGPASEGYCCPGWRTEREIVLSLPGLLGMLVFWVIKQL